MSNNAVLNEKIDFSNTTKKKKTHSNSFAAVFYFLYKEYLGPELTEAMSYT
jgi:hypothetical protein